MKNYEKYEKAESNIKNLETKLNEQSENITILNKEIDLLLIINNIICQRDTYKKTLEELIKILIEKYGINTDEANTNGPLWKKTKIICELLSKSDKIEKDKCQKIINGLKSLIFCKDYFNCLINAKGAFSKQLKTYNELTNNMPIISIASFENMKEITQKFFCSVINDIDDFKFINLLFLDKIRNWSENEHFNYNDYFSKENLKSENIMKDFEFAINLIEENNIKNIIDNSLENQNP